MASDMNCRLPPALDRRGGALAAQDVPKDNVRHGPLHDSVWGWRADILTPAAPNRLSPTMPLGRENALAHLTAASRTWRAGGVLLRRDITLGLPLSAGDACFWSSVSCRPCVGDYQPLEWAGARTQTCLCRPVGKPMWTRSCHSAGQRRRYPSVAFWTALAEDGSRGSATTGGRFVLYICRHGQRNRVIDCQLLHDESLQRCCVGSASCRQVTYFGTALQES